jgi:hypothetical protein
MICAVAICNNPKNDSTIYHHFPKNNELSKKWVVACKRDDQFNPSTSTVCSNHFLPTDYERDLKNELLGLPVKKRLQREAVPTVNINPNGSKDLSSVKIQEERKKRMEKREQKILVEDLFQKDTSIHNAASHDQSPNNEILKSDQGTQTVVNKRNSIGIQVGLPKSEFLSLIFSLLVTGPLNLSKK